MMRAPEQFRITKGDIGTDPSYGPNGFFRIPSDYGNRPLDVIACSGTPEACGPDQVAVGWEHVSVKVHINKYTYTPSWDEMCLVKNLFWDSEDTVMQLHPRASVSVNYHPNVLHLWRPAHVWDEVGIKALGPTWPIPEPPAELVGPSGVSFLEREGL